MEYNQFKKMKMKKLNYLILFFAALTFAACNTENDDFDIEYSAIHPIGGQYRISITDETGQNIEVPSTVYCFISNTASESKTECWLRIGSYNTSPTAVYSINGKLSCNLSDLSFSGTDVINLAGNVSSSDETFTVTDGKIELQAATAPSETRADKISFTFTRTNFPGKTFHVTGFRYTGWPED